MTGWEEIVAGGSFAMVASGLIGGAIWNLSKTIERLRGSFEANQVACRKEHESLNKDRDAAWEQQRDVNKVLFVKSDENKDRIDSHIADHLKGVFTK